MLLDDRYGAPRRLSPAELLKQLHIDLPLVIALLLIAAFGLFVLYSASGQNIDMMYRQGLRLFVAFSVMFLFSQVTMSIWRFWSFPLYTIGILLLLAVLLFGDLGKGAQRWLDIGIVRFQPSELLKIALPLAVAVYLHDRLQPPSLFTIIGGIGLVLLPTALIAQQPDLGTALLIAGGGLFGVFFSGIRWRTLLIGGAITAALVPIMWFFVMLEYQKRRVLTFLNPENDPLGAGYHIIQSKIAVGSGGIFGKGWLNGTQSQLDFLPERSTDFIFAVLAEELGLFGILPLLGLYLFVIGRGLYIAAQAQSTFERLLAGSLSLIFFFYVFVNTGMVTGLLPVVGVPLPLVSYGGTSMVTLMAGFGILMGIHTNRKLVNQ